MDNNIEWLRTNNETSYEVIHEVEQYFDICFPEDYIEIVMKHHGQTPIPDSFEVNGSDESFDILLSFDSKNTNYILRVYKNIEDQLLSKIYPIARDPFGNMICFDYRTSKEPAVVFWEHERTTDSIVFICDTFTELLSMLKESSDDD